MLACSGKDRASAYSCGTAFPWYRNFVSVFAGCPVKNHFDMYSCSILFANQLQYTFRVRIYPLIQGIPIKMQRKSAIWVTFWAVLKLFLAILFTSLLSLPNRCFFCVNDLNVKKKKKGIGASIWLPQYFLFGILGIQGYLTLSIRFKLALQR